MFIYQICHIYLQLWRARFTTFSPKSTERRVTLKLCISASKCEVVPNAVSAFAVTVIVMCEMYEADLRNILKHKKESGG